MGIGLRVTNVDNLHDLHNRGIDHLATSNWGTSVVGKTAWTMGKTLCATTRMMTTLLMS